MIRILSAKEIDLVSGGDGDNLVHVVYWDPTAGQGSGGLVDETWSADGTQFIGLSIDYPSDQSSAIDSGTFYGSVGSGIDGLVGGVTVSTSPTDVYVYGGFGTPGPSVAGGYSNTSDLSGPAINVGTNGHIGGSLAFNARDGSVGYSTPGASVTYQAKVSAIMYKVAGAIDSAIMNY